MENKTGPGKGNNPNSRKNLKPIQKGEVRNPDGGRAHDAQLRELKKFTTEYLREVIDACVMEDLETLDALTKSKSAPAIQVGVARALFKGISDGNWDVIEKVLARIIGKVPDKIDHTSGGNPIGGGGLTIEFVKAGKNENPTS